MRRGAGQGSRAHESVERTEEDMNTPRREREMDTSTQAHSECVSSAVCSQAMGDRSHVPCVY